MWIACNKDESVGLFINKPVRVKPNIISRFIFQNKDYWYGDCVGFITKTELDFNIDWTYEPIEINLEITIK